jgi:hypothetical protein
MNIYIYIWVYIYIYIIYIFIYICVLYRYQSIISINIAGNLIHLFFCYKRNISTTSKRLIFCGPPKIDHDWILLTIPHGLTYGYVMDRLWEVSKQQELELELARIRNQGWKREENGGISHVEPFNCLKIGHEPCWWFGFFLIFFHMLGIWEFHNPNRRSPSFFRGVGWNHQPGN